MISYKLKILFCLMFVFTSCSNAKIENSNNKESINSRNELISEQQFTVEDFVDYFSKLGNYSANVNLNTYLSDNGMIDNENTFIIDYKKNDKEIYYHLFDNSKNLNLFYLVNSSYYYHCFGTSDDINSYSSVIKDKSRDRADSPFDLYKQISKYLELSKYERVVKKGNDEVEYFDANTFKSENNDLYTKNVESLTVKIDNELHEYYFDIVLSENMVLDDIEDYPIQYTIMSIKIFDCCETSITIPENFE